MWNKRHKKTLVYLRDFSIVVLGVAVTLIGTRQIEKIGEWRDTRQYMEALKMELEGNLEIAEVLRDYYTALQDFGNMLRSTPRGELALDTLNKYKDVTNNFEFTKFKTGAFDMFKASGQMRLIKDKGLIGDIWDSYNTLAIIQESHDYFTTKFADELFKAVGNMNDFSIDIREPEQTPLYKFYLSQHENYLLWINEIQRRNLRMLLDKIDEYI